MCYCLLQRMSLLPEAEMNEDYVLLISALLG